MRNTVRGLNVLCFALHPVRPGALGKTQETAGVHWAYWRRGGNVAGSYARSSSRSCRPSGSWARTRVRPLANGCGSCAATARTRLDRGSQYHDRVSVGEGRSERHEQTFALGRTLLIRSRKRIGSSVAIEPDSASRPGGSTSRNRKMFF